MDIYEKIGTYNVDFSKCLNANGSLKLDSIKEVYQKIALDIISNEIKPENTLRREYFNFFCNLSELKGRELAQYLDLADGQISQWRRDESKNISDLSWGQIRAFFGDLFKNKEITNPAFIANKNFHEKKKQITI